MKTKLLYFASDYKIGLSSLLSDQLLSIASKGIDVYAVAGDNEQEQGLSEKLTKNNIKIERVKNLDSHSNFNEKVKKIKAIVEYKGIDIIHVQNNWQLAIAGSVKCALLRKKKIKIAYTLHGFRNNNPIKARIAQLIIGCALWVLVDYVICMTEYLTRKFGLLSYKIKKIPLGIKNEFFVDEYVIPATESLKIVYPAQFREGKNQDTVIRAFAEFVCQSGDSSSMLILPGEGDLKDKMIHIVHELGLENQVFFPGLLPKDSIKNLYLSSNIAVVASNSETFGQSIVEPFVLGRCVLSTPVGIAPEIINDGINGYLFHCEKELTEKMLYLYRHKELIVRMGEANFLQRDLFRWDTVTDKYITEILKEE